MNLENRFMSFSSESKKVFTDACKTSFTLFKIMIPASIIVKILIIYGIVEILAGYLSPVMNVVGLPGDFGLVWGTAMITNIYGGLIVFFNLSLANSYSVAQVTVLATMMLISHTFPIEVRIAQKAGVRARFTILFRFINAVIIGGILSFIFLYFNIFQEESKILWQPGITNPTLTQWGIGELRNYAMIFLIIFSLLVLIRVLKNIGVIEKLNIALEPGLKFLGMSKNAAPLAIIGLTLGISYGGGLIIREVKEKALSKKDAFLSLSMMGLLHSLIEDTILMLAIGASLVGILFARIVFTIAIMVILIQIINRASSKTFDRFFSKNN